MFQDLDDTLRALLTAEDVPPEVRAADVSFDTPDKDFGPTQATVNLFLHDVQENRALRDVAPVVERVDERVDSGYRTSRPPLRLDCTYLVTAWSGRTGGLKAAEEHQLLGLALRWLSRFDVVEDRFLRGGMTRPPQSHAPPAAVAQVREGQSMGQFWTALGVPPRPAFSLTVTIDVPPFDAPVDEPPLRSVGFEHTSLEHPELRGRVLTRALTPVSGARVSVGGNGAVTTTDAAGVFAFGGLPFGSYVLLVRVAGRADTEAPVEYRADSQFHPVILPNP
ncbi:Pvc16 family protein [Streptomyces sp. NPDC014864]|uniref:Pvc16 family protein n=1 Tax=Streptomyces sp. NPDC014864 TaxID=3364924 RepID=UPI003700C314